MGQNTKRINWGWWIDQIRAGEEFRKKYALQSRWEDWRAYYRGRWDSGILPVNLYFMILRSLVPRVYYRDPAVSITPAKPGTMNAVFAQIQERIDNKLIRTMRLKRTIKRMIQDAFLFGTACGKLGFSTEFGPNPDSEPPILRSGERVEYTQGISLDMPWFRRVHPKDLIVPAGCSDIDEAYWIAHRVRRPLADVKKDPRFRNTNELKSYSRERVEVSYSSGQTFLNPIEMIDLYEIRDRKYDRVIILSGDQRSVLYEGPDDMPNSLFPLVFNPDDEVFWGVPDAQIIEPQQLEINEIRTQAMKHRRITLVKILYEEGAISEVELQKMVDEDVGGGVKAKDINKILPLKVGDIPISLERAAEQIRSDIRETVGFSRNQMGEMHPKSGAATATEASIVQMSSEIRVDERKDLVGDMIEDMIRSLHSVIYSIWEGEQVIDLIGPGGVPIWLAFKPQMLKNGAFEIAVHSDTGLPQSRVAREQKALQVYSILKENPLIDPMGLTRYLLREMHGVEYDDLMRGLPPGLGQQQPMQIAQYTQMLQNAQQKGLPAPSQKGGG